MFRREGHARYLADRRNHGDGVGRPVRGAGELRGLLALDHLTRGSGGGTYFHRAESRRRTCHDAVGENFLVAEIRHASRSVRRWLDGLGHAQAAGIRSKKTSERRTSEPQYRRQERDNQASLSPPIMSIAAWAIA